MYDKNFYDLIFFHIKNTEMWYGNIIFIKKTGGDGSKYPVTQRDIKIGRSKECLIRIYNPQIAAEHCQLIIEENGQAILRSFSNHTILNGKPLGHKDVALCHGDTFKLGERLARWEYLPSSKYYRQLLSPTGRLVAVVMPQQRPSTGKATSKASVLQVTASESTPLGKKRYSGRATGESSVIKMRKSKASDTVQKSKGDLSKFLNGRVSSETGKLILQGQKVKERRSISGIVSSNTPKEKVKKKLRKSTLPLWKVNVASPPRKISLSSRKSLKKSPSESVKLLESISDTPSKKITESDFTEKYSLTSKSKMKTPKKVLTNSEPLEEVRTSTSKVALKASLKTAGESPIKSGRRSSKSKLMSKNFSSLRKSSLKYPSDCVSSTPKPKSPKISKLFFSESKLSSVSKKRSSLFEKSKRMSVMLDKLDLTPTKSMEKEKAYKLKILEVVSNNNSQTHLKDNLSNGISRITKTSPSKSQKSTPVQKSSARARKTVGRTSEKKTLESAQKLLKVHTPTKYTPPVTPNSLKKKQSRTPRIRISKKLNLVPSEKNTSLIILENTTSPKNPASLSVAAENTSSNKTPAKSAKKIKKTQSPSPSRKISLNQDESRISSFSSIVDVDTHFLPMNSVRSSERKRRFLNKKIPALEATSWESASHSRARIASPRGVRRKLSPSSSAEKAAKKLKISSPRKPDKNKKAALLVLGKADRKLFISQNIKVLLKQRIVKKALKQSNGVSGNKDESRKIIANKLKQELRKKFKSKTNRKPKKYLKTHKSSEKIVLPSQTSKATDASTSFLDNIARDDNSENKKFSEVNQLNTSDVLQTPSRLSSKSTSIEDTPKCPFEKQKKLLEFSQKIKNDVISSSSGFGKNAENYLLNSFRRSSKRLSSKNDTGRPDFVELSPTALGLIPKNLEIFKTPKDSKRKSSSLVTPKNVRTSGIIKSASTSKIASRKSVRFSPKDVSYKSGFSSPDLSEKTELDFSSFHTPNITMDVFVSPLSEKSNATKNDMDDSKALFEEEGISKFLNKNSRSSSESKFCVKKLRQSPQSEKNSDIILSNQKTISRNGKTSVMKLTSSVKVSSKNGGLKSHLSNCRNVRQSFETPNIQKSLGNEYTDLTSVKECLETLKIQQNPKSDLTDVKGVKKLLRTPRVQKSPKNDLTDVRGVKKLLRTPKVQKSPKNDLTDVRGVKKLLRTPKVQKSPKNDLTDVSGVKKLLRTPKVQKSPKNDLTDVSGVKKLLRTPKVQKSPKNDLTDIRGVKKLLRTPKVQKSPKNDLTDVRGVKKLLRTPKVQKSPKNDLTDVRGVKKLLRTPRVQKSPKNDLTDVRGVKKLLRTPKVQKSPKNDLTDVRGVKKLLRTPKVQKSPKNDLTDVRGVKKLLRTPKVQKSSKNDLTDVRGVKKLLRTPKVQKSPKNDLTDVRGVKKLLRTPKVQKSPKNDLTDISGVKKLLRTPKAQKSPKNSLSDLNEVENLFRFSVKKEMSEKLTESNGSKKLMKSLDSPWKSRVNDFRAIRGRPAVRPAPKGPKNDLSDVMGVRELFLRHQPMSNHNISFTGVPELFNLPTSKAVSKQKTVKNARKSYSQVPEANSLRRRKALESQDDEEENRKISTRETRLRKATKVEIEKKTAKNSKLNTTELQEESPRKRIEVEKVKTSSAKRTSSVKKSLKIGQTAKKPGVKLRTRRVVKTEDDNVKIKNCRKRIFFEEPESSPPKLRRKLRETETSSATNVKDNSQNGLLKTRNKSGSKRETSRKRVQKVSVKKKDEELEVSSKVQIKKAIKNTGKKQTEKVQSKRSQNSSKNNSESEEIISPRKTRSVKTKAIVKKVSVNKSKSPKISRENSKRKMSSPVVKRSTRRKAK